MEPNTMSCTKQTPRNPNVDRPATAIGSDVQPEGRNTSKHKSGKQPTKGGKQPQKHLLHRLIRQNKPVTGGNQEIPQILAWISSIKRD